MSIMDCRISVLLRISEKDFAAFSANQNIPEGVLADIRTCGDTLPAEYPQKQDVVLITDDAAFLRAAAQQQAGLRLIYLGAAAEIADLIDSIEDLWPAEEPEKIRSRRFERLLCHIKTEYDAWFHENTLLTTINSLPDMLWFKRLDGIHMLVNDEFCRVVRKEKNDIHGKDHFYIWDVPRPAEGSAEFACAESEEIAIRTDQTYICDEIVQLSDEMKQLTTYKTPIKDRFGNVFGTVGIGRDVTDFSNLGIELSILVENLPFPTIIFSEDWKVVRMSSSFYSLAGTDADSAMQFDYRTWKKERLIPVSEEKKDEKKHSAERTFRLPSGKMDRFFIIREQGIHDYFNNITGYFCTMQDITYQRSYEQSILEAANTDMLTGLYNRRYFYHYLNAHKGQAMTLLYMDLDRFKEVNDCFGHAKGDDVLVQTAKMIRETFREAAAARLGGDEFAVLLPAKTADISQKCEQLEQTLRAHFRNEGLNVTLSIGTASYSGASDDIDRVIHESDVQMYAEKKRHHEEQDA